MAKPPVKLKKKIFSKKLLSNLSFKQGCLAETIASAFLTKNNYQILARNLRFKNHELDIIALDLQYDEYVFTEVKWRKNNRFGEGSDAVDYKKILSMQIVAKQWLKKQKFPKAWRFDIISLVGNLQSQNLKIRHFKNITWL
ncbi:MAG: YraN family protein [Candidatus Pacebacteria bacterium]|nr:YraN family protein [Candidatus Paceibacterota bacterium]